MRQRGQAAIMPAIKSLDREHFSSFKLLVVSTSKSGGLAKFEEISEHEEVDLSRL